MGCCDDGSCECGHKNEITIEDIVQNNNIILNTLIDMLIEKGIFSEEELRLKLSDVAKKLEESSHNHEHEIEEELEELNESSNESKE